MRQRDGLLVPAFACLRCAPSWGKLRRMKGRAKLDTVTLDRWHAMHTDWERVSCDSISREYKFDDFKSALAFVNKVGELAEHKNHHPDITLGWGRVRVLYTTHDAGGLTQLDLDMAEATDKLA